MVTTEERKEFFEWAKGLPDKARRSALSHPAVQLYRDARTGHRVYIDSYANDGTVTIVVSGQFNHVAMERNVFGIDVSSLSPCDPPSEDEPVGVTLSDDEQLELINNMRIENGVPPAPSLDELRSGSSSCAVEHGNDNGE
ncbi:MAG: hypothetical protein KAG66_21565 [Methylococcales bacterium]|nr:hypothetical protein [Methylococcales bacterium]